MDAFISTTPVENELFIEPYRGSWHSLLAYFKNRTQVHFPKSKGKAAHIEQAEALLRNEFEFNNERHQLSESFNWTDNPSHDLEWLILLHKFYYLKELAGAYDYCRDERYARKWVSLIDSWISQVPDGFIDTQVTGRRLQQWIQSYHIFIAKWRSASVSPDFFERFMRSIYSQTHYLCEHLTPEGNHRTLELYAIFVVAITFPELQSAEYFLRFSARELLNNMRQDLLPDGVHRELSTDYHHTVLKNYLRFRELASLNHIQLPVECDALLIRALEFSYYVHKPDGYIPSINDGDCNSYLPLLKKAFNFLADPHLHYVLTQGELGLPPVQRSRGFPDSGYYILRSEWTMRPYPEAHYLFFDCASLGFGSHGHYDALNIEVAAFGRSLIVDPGRYTYSEKSTDGINWRHYFKGTSAHNTVVVDGLDQISYQCERPVDPEPETQLKQFVSAPGFDFLHGLVKSHRYRAIHERKIFFQLANYWILTDRLSSAESHRYDLYFHLAETAHSLTRLTTQGSCHLLQAPNLLIAQPDAHTSCAELEQGFVAPEYGIKHPAPILKFSKEHAGNALFHTVIFPFDGEPPVLQVKTLPVYPVGFMHETFSASALKISITDSEGDAYEDYYFINHGEIEIEYDFGDIQCAARVLLIRKNSQGEIINFQGEQVSYVKMGSSILLEQLHGWGRVCYRKNCLTFTNTELSTSMTWQDLEIFPQWHDLLNLRGMREFLSQ